MKKFFLYLLAGLYFPAFSSGAMDAETLLSSPERYRILYSAGTETAYVDMQSISGQQTMDLPSSLENVNFTLYVESYKNSPDAFDFEDRNLVSHIREFSVQISANKREQSYTMDYSLLAKYNAKGDILSCYDSIKEIPSARQLPTNAKTFYIHLKRQENR